MLEIDMFRITLDALCVAKHQEGRHQEVILAANSRAHEAITQYREFAAKTHPAPQDVVAEIFTAVAQNNKIGAIKAVRTLTSLGLKEAKDFVEQWSNLFPLAK